tara:strand:- start:3219 stop:3866 length:648 start_codon:yes stop_codon:yes gene_type:complete
MSQSSKMHDFFIGGIIGLVQAGIGHPFDTAKTLLQNGQSFRNLRPLEYYRGVAYPTVASLAFNVITFPMFGKLQAKTNNNAYLSGAIAGIAIAPIDYAFDVGKIRRQTLSKVPLHLKGITLSCLRTVIAQSVYFGVYFDLTQTTGPLIAGAAAGLANWTITYPLDIVSTRQIAGNLLIREAIHGGLWRGYLPCAVRAVLVNSATFYVYEKLKKDI